MSQQMFDEQLVLAILLDQPREHGWELGGLDARWFTAPAHRKVAEAICAMRDLGQSVDYRRVARRVGRKGSALYRFVHDLRNALGVPYGLTAAISRLQFTAARRSA